MINILIVEDDITRILWFQKEFEDCRIVVAKTANQGIRTINKERFSLIFLDNDLGEGIGIGIVLLVISAIALFSAWIEDIKILKKMCLWGIIMGTIFCITGCFIPTTKEMAVIYVVPKIINNEKIQQMPDKLLTLANHKLDEWTKIKETK